MGAAESNPIRNMDKRTARREYRDDFCSAITNFRRGLANCQAEGLSSFNKKNDDKWQNGMIRVCVRKRPIFKDEVEKSEFDIVTCIGEDMVVIHDARMHTDMKKQYINHHEFAFDRVFDENQSNEYVYNQTAAPLVDIALSGGDATCLMYGQTGSGKTYTMSSIYHAAAADIFDQLSTMSPDKGGEDGSNVSVSVSFIEIAGEKCFDLLHCFSPTDILKGSDEDTFQAFPVCEPRVANSRDLQDIISYGCNCRSTAATGVHDASSRSHAVLKIYIRNGRAKEGSLTLVDLAGSEHRIDSMHHSSSRRKEGALINKSLLALKDCIRSRAEGRDLDHFYRKSKLTLTLKSSFVKPAARTAVIVTVSPASKDTEHSLNTLRHACIMDGQDTSAGGTEKRFLTGGVITKEHVGEVDVSTIARRNRELLRGGQAVPGLKSCNGNQMSGNAGGATDHTFGGYGEDVGGGSGAGESAAQEKEQARQRQVAERRAAAQLPHHVLRLLESTRRALCSDPFRASRVGKVPAKVLEKAIAASHISVVGTSTTAAPPRRTTNKRSSKSSRIINSSEGSVVAGIIGHMHEQQRKQRWENIDDTQESPYVDTKERQRGGGDGGGSRRGGGTAAAGAVNGEQQRGRGIEERGAQRGRAAHLPTAPGATSQRDHSPICRPTTKETSLPQSVSMAKLILASGQAGSAGSMSARSRPGNAEESRQGNESSISSRHRHRGHHDHQQQQDQHLEKDARAVTVEESSYRSSQAHPKGPISSKLHSPLRNRHKNPYNDDNCVLPGADRPAASPELEIPYPDSPPARTPNLSKHSSRSDFNSGRGFNDKESTDNVLATPSPCDVENRDDGVGYRHLGKKSTEEKKGRVRLTRAASLRREHAKNRISELEEETQSASGRSNGRAAWCNAQPWVSPVVAEGSAEEVGGDASGLPWRQRLSKNSQYRQQCEWDSSPPSAKCDEGVGGSGCSEGHRRNKRQHNHAAYRTGRPFDHGQRSNPWNDSNGGACVGGMWFHVDMSDEKPIRPNIRYQQHQHMLDDPIVPPPSSTPMGNDIRATPPRARNVWSVEMAQERYGNSPLWS